MGSHKVTRFPSGLNNVRGDKPLANYGMPDPSIYHSYFNDFDTYAAGDWTITAVGTGTSALSSVDGGILLVTNSAADNDGRQHQLVTNGFTMQAGKSAFFKARFALSDVVNSDLLIGLATLDTTLLGAIGGDGVTDGIFFYKDDGVPILNISCQKDVTTSQVQNTSIATLSPDIYVEVAWAYDGIDAIEYFIDGVKKGTLSASSTYLPDASLSVSFALLNGEAIAKIMSLDYIFAAKER